MQDRSINKKQNAQNRTNNVVGALEVRVSDIIPVTHLSTKPQLTSNATQRTARLMFLRSTVYLRSKYIRSTQVYIYEVYTCRRPSDGVSPKTLGFSVPVLTHSAGGRAVYAGLVAEDAATLVHLQ